jgi:hypothetical protein
MLLGGLAAAFGFVVTSDTRETVAVVTPPTTPTTPQEPTVVDHGPAILREDPTGWSPPEPMDIAEPPPPSTASPVDPATEGRVEQIVGEANHFLELGRHEEAEVVLRQIGEGRIPPGSHAAEIAAVALMRLGDGLSQEYREHPNVSDAEVPMALAQLEQRIVTTYTKAMGLGGERYMLCAAAKQGAFQLVAAHTAATWPAAVGGSGEQMAGVGRTVAAARVEAATSLLEQLLSQEGLQETPLECRRAAESVLASARARP